MKLNIIFATGNQNKVREVREIIQDPETSVYSMKEAGVPAEPEETGTTFEENAVIKASAVAALVKERGLPDSIPQDRPVCVMSDDSGLVVDAMGGAPGIYSARYMGHDTDYTVKMNAILEELRDVLDEKRTARFVAAVACVIPGGQACCPGDDIVLTTTGTMEGRIGHTIRGANGFGYDPFFYLPEYGMTSAELAPAEKDAISHRGKAVRAMMERLRGIFS